MSKVNVRLVKQVVVNGQEDNMKHFYLDCELPSAPLPFMTFQFGGWIGEVGPFERMRYNFPEQRYELLLPPEIFVDSDTLNFGEYSKQMEDGGWMSL